MMFPGRTQELNVCAFISLLFASLNVKTLHKMEGDRFLMGIDRILHMSWPFFALCLPARADPESVVLPVYPVFHL